MKTDNLESFLEKVRGGKLALGCANAMLLGFAEMMKEVVK